jgi:hypothetical protein
MLSSLLSFFLVSGSNVKTIRFKFKAIAATFLSCFIKKSKPLKKTENAYMCTYATVAAYVRLCAVTPLWRPNVSTSDY